MCVVVHLRSGCRILAQIAVLHVFERAHSADKTYMTLYYNKVYHSTMCHIVIGYATL